VIFKCGSHRWCGDKVEFVRLSNVHPDRWMLKKWLRLAEQESTTMQELIRKTGLIIPILVRANGDIADGHHRYCAARALGREWVPVIFVTRWYPRKMPERTIDYGEPHRIQPDVRAYIKRCATIYAFIAG
jgi:hypothetical protein